MEYEVVISVRRKGQPYRNLCTRVLGACHGYKLALELIHVVIDMLNGGRAAE